MATLIHERVGLARAGRNPTVIRRLPAGWVVIGDVQYLKGYCLFLADPVVESLEDLPLDKRVEFLRELAVVGEAVRAATGAGRMNYSILGNKDHALHAHLHPRYPDEPAELRAGPPWGYKARPPVPLDLARDKALMDGIGQALDDLCRRHGIPCAGRRCRPRPIESDTDTRMQWNVLSNWWLLFGLWGGAQTLAVVLKEHSRATFFEILVISLIAGVLFGLLPVLYIVAFYALRAL